MKRIIALLAASFLASTAISAPVFAQDNGNDNGASDNSARDFAPGQAKEDGESAREDAPGQMKSEGESARDYAPGQRKAQGSDDDGIDDDTTGSIGDQDITTVITLIQSGDFDLSNVTAETDVTVVELENLSDEDRQALEDALSDSQEQINAFREDLAGLSLEELDQSEIDAAVAAQIEADGSVVVYVQ